MFASVVTVAVVVAASQVSMCYFRDPVANNIGTTTIAAAGWPRLAFLRAQGQQGSLCYKDSVVHLPDASKDVCVARWVPADSSKKRNVILPDEDGDDRKIIKEFYQKFTTLGGELALNYARFFPVTAPVASTFSIGGRMW